MSGGRRSGRRPLHRRDEVARSYGWSTVSRTARNVWSLNRSSLAGGFEAIHALHVGVERIGRYVQVYYENAEAGPRWENTVMALGPALPGGGIDPLFTVVFTCAAFVNVIPALALQPRATATELSVVGVLHLALVIRIVRARGAAARQRAVELETFRAIRSQLPSLNASQHIP